MPFTDEQIEKARNCKTIEELKALAKTEGFNFTDEETSAYFNATRTGELSDEDLSSISGGKGGEWKILWVPGKVCDCPFCHTRLMLRAEIYYNTKTYKTKTINKVTRCSCGATIEYYNATNNFKFKKNGIYKDPE